MRTMLPVCSMGGFAAICFDLLVAATPTGPDAAEDMDLTGGAVRQVDVSPSRWRRQIDSSVHGQVALEGGLERKSRNGRPGNSRHQRRCRNKKMLHGPYLTFKRQG